MDDKKQSKKAKNLFDSLKIDPSSILFSEEILDKKLLNKLRKSRYETDKLFYKLVNLLDSKNVFSENKAPTRADYVEKREIDCSTLYSFDGPFQLLHADVGNLEFLGKLATFSHYVLVIVDLFSSKFYSYSMKSRKQILQKVRVFYDDVRNKRKGKRMRLQVDNEFQQVKVKDLNDINNVEMLTSAVRGGKAFAAEQKIRELKTRIAKINAQKLKVSPSKITEMSTANTNLRPSKKYGLAPEEVERCAPSDEDFKTIFKMKGMEKTQKLHCGLDDYDKKKYSLKKKQLREDLSIGEKVYVLAERIKKKSAP